MAERSGRLTVVGTGIGFRRQLPPAAEAVIRAADRLLYQVDDPLTAGWLHELNGSAEPLPEPAADELVLSQHVYEAMAERVVAAVRAGCDVCFVAYGHPGVYQHAAHRAIELVRSAGLEATMLPGISALDCLIADLGIEIAGGCQLHDATSLVVQRKPLDPTSALVVFQVGIFGNPYYGGDRPVRLRLLGDRLRAAWGPRHEATLYEAAMRPEDDPVVHAVRLTDLEVAPITTRTLLYLAPAIEGECDIVATAEIASWLASVR